MEPKEILTGGNMRTVSRLGGTVRREAGPWTKQVQWLLAHLRANGILEVPAPLGFDELGREMLSYLPGEVGHYPLSEAMRSDVVLISAAKLLRRIHDATTAIAQVRLSGWQAPTRQPVEVICHGDFAPYNCVFEAGKISGVIDFDHAHPGPRLWDLAYALYRFAPLTAPSNSEGFGNLAEQARRARLFCDAYGLDDRLQVLPRVIARVQFMAERLLEGARQGDARMQANIAAGHLAIYQADAEYIEAQQEFYRRALSE
jgi:Ser/Thr protein kinase RdoA (MazF antagonist)